jgi:hypothetical protein
MSLTTFYYSDRPPTTSADTVITSSSRDPSTNFLLTGLKIGDTVTGIESSAFFNCQNLQGPVNIPNSILDIGAGAFFRCYSLGGSFNIPNSVLNINAVAFFEAGISNFVIGSGLMNLGRQAFQTFGLTGVLVDPYNLNFSNDEYGVLFNKNKTLLIQYAIHSTGMNYIIPNGVITIGQYSFRDSTYLTSVNIPNSTTTIEEAAFYPCFNLTNVTFGNSVATIGSSAFRESNLKSITLGNSVAAIGDSAFSESLLIKSVFLEGSPAIGRSAFEYCTKLGGVYCSANAPSAHVDAFLNANGGLKFYRKKNFVTGWSGQLVGKPVVLWSDNVIKSIDVTSRYINKITLTGATNQPSVNRDYFRSDPRNYIFTSSSANYILYGTPGPNLWGVVTGNSINQVAFYSQNLINWNVWNGLSPAPTATVTYSSSERHINSISLSGASQAVTPTGVGTSFIWTESYDNPFANFYSDYFIADAPNESSSYKWLLSPKDEAPPPYTYYGSYDLLNWESLDLPPNLNPPTGAIISYNIPEPPPIIYGKLTTKKRN